MNAVSEEGWTALHYGAQGKIMGGHTDSGHTDVKPMARSSADDRHHHDCVVTGPLWVWVMTGPTACLWVQGATWRW